jgi:hypothetical protein
MHLDVVHLGEGERQDIGNAGYGQVAGHDRLEEGEAAAGAEHLGRHRG